MRKTLSPHLRQEWDFEKNVGFSPDTVPLGSKIHLWWNCPQGHSYEARIDHRMRNNGNGTGCKICRGTQSINIGVNDLASQCPEVAATLHPKLNGNITAESVRWKSDKILTWICPSKHIWQAAVKHRTAGTGCPTCGYGSISRSAAENKAVKAKMREEWHPTLNTVTFEQADKDKNKQCFWLCSKGHAWHTTFGLKYRWETTCRVCSNRQVLTGYNDLATIYPHYAAEWHPTRNGTLTPEKIVFQSGQKVWWLCKNGHEWETVVKDRTSKGYGCEECAAQNKVYSSDTEYVIAEYFKRKGHSIITSTRKPLKNRQEIDIYFPDLQIGIEFNGDYWHSEEKGKAKQYHAAKYEQAVNAGIKLIYVWEYEWNMNPAASLEQLTQVIEGKKTKPEKDKVTVDNGSVAEYLLDLSEYTLVRIKNATKKKHPKYTLWNAGSKVYQKN